MTQFNFGGVVEDVITSEEFSLQKARDVLQNETVAEKYGNYALTSKGKLLADRIAMELFVD